MASAYAALVSLTHVLDNIQLYGHHLISLDTNITESLRGRVNFLIDFLENYSNLRGIKEAITALESQTRDAAYAAEDLIETHVVDQILDPTMEGKKKVDLVEEHRPRSSQGHTNDVLTQGLNEVIYHFDFIKKEVMKILEGSQIQIEDQQPKISTVVAVSTSRIPPVEDNGVVGLEEVAIEILDRLSSGQESRRQIIPISGMGGIGKTTLARYIYANPLTVEHFPYRAWVTISQEYSVKDILSSILKALKEYIEPMASEDTLGEVLHKKLFGRRYLIVMDDIWSIEAWDKVKLFLPDNNNGSRVMMTTRLSNVSHLFSSCGIEMGFLNDDQSWTLFCKKTFGGEEDCPIELEGIGKKIVKKCRGLPLAISVIGGFLAKSVKTKQFWEYVAEDVNSIINSEDGENCSKLLELSYSNLPMHLKPCFLYFGFYPEDHVFDVSKLIKIWTAEGFLKPNKDKTLEEIAEDCIRDLVDRNLILVRKIGRLGNIKECHMHDLLRELGLKELRKDHFLPNIQLQPCVNGHRRLFIPRSISEKKESMDQIFCSLESTRSLISDAADFRVPWQTFRLLRVWVEVNSTSMPLDPFCEAKAKLVNSRYLENHGHISLLSMHQFWNLQTLIIREVRKAPGVLVPNEIWEMRQLRHIIIEGGFSLPLPQSQMDGTDDRVVLQNLQTLLMLLDFTFTEEVVKRIPNIKKLMFGSYGRIKDLKQLSGFCLNNLSRLSKLESFVCNFSSLYMEMNIAPASWLAFPYSLKRLSLKGCKLPWEDMTIIGSLPNLQVLKLLFDAFVGPEWKPNEGEFLCLRFLQMFSLDLQVWVADNTHFPCLQHLKLSYMRNLMEIPLEFSDISALRSIVLCNCNESTRASAQRIVDERESYGDQDLQLQIE